LKTNIHTITDALNKVKKLRGVSYQRISDNSNNIGVIAQEVQEVIPEAVQQDSNDMMSVAYGNLVGVLIEAIKELSAEVEALKNSSCKCECK
jgi:transketolase C-terminal domain/subunit